MEDLRTLSCETDPIRVFRSAPLFPVAVGLCAGVALDALLQVGLLVYLGLFVVLSASTVIRGLRVNAGPLLILLSATCVGSTLHLSTTRTIPASGVAWHLASTGRKVRPDRRIARVHGKVTSAPRLTEKPLHPFARWMFRADRTSFLLDTEAIESADGEIPASGLIRVTVDEAVLDLLEGERIEAFGWLYQSQPPRNPGQFDWRAFHRRQGIVAGMKCKHKENIRRLGTDRPFPSSSRLSRLRTRVGEMLTSDLATGVPEEQTDLLEAMVLGHRSRLDRRMNDIFIRAGCVHFLAVSGLHIAVPMSFVWWMGRRLGASTRTCAWLMLIAVLAYVVVAEPRPPILRAGIMGTLFCLSLVLNRPRSGLNWLAAAAIVLVLISPATVFDAGFQLSFAAILGILYLTLSFRGWAAASSRGVTGPARRRPGDGNDSGLSIQLAPSHSKARSIATYGLLFARRYIVWPVAVSLGAWLATLPIVASHFFRIHPWAPISSVVVFPFVYVLILASFTKILVEAACPGWGSLLAGPIGALESWLLHLVDWLGSLPQAVWFVTSPPWWWIVAWYLFLIMLARRFRPPATSWDEQSGEFVQSPPARSRWLTRTYRGAFACLVLVSVVWGWPRGPTDRLVVTVLSVGAGSAMVVELPDGPTILCDAGNRSTYDVGRHTVVPFLRHRGIRHVDRMYISHPNLDHYSGIPSIAEDIGTGPIVVNEYFQLRSMPNSAIERLLNLLAEQGVGVEVLDFGEPRWEFGGVAFELLWPPEGLHATVPSNETSTVLRLTYAGRSILFTGDIEDYAQQALLEQGNISADVLVLPHHGGVESSSKAFIDAVGAATLIRSSDQSKVETFNGLYEVAGNTPVYNTADVGAVRITIDRTGVEVATLWD